MSSEDLPLLHPPRKGHRTTHIQTVYPTIITDLTDLSMGVKYEITPVLIDSNTTRKSNPALKSRKA